VRIGRRVRELFSRWRWYHLPFVAATALVVSMYCTNVDMGGDRASPRGDGHYRPVLARGDGHMMFLMARSMAFDGDWDFDNDLGRFGDPWNQVRGPNGHKVIPHPVGPPLVWTPLLWIAEGGAVVANLFGAGIPLHGYTPWHQRFVFLSSVVAAIVAVLLAMRVARACGGPWAQSYAGVTILLGTPLTYYATYMASYGHALDGAACAGFLAYWALTIGRIARRRWIILGILLGLAMLVRMQDMALGVVLLVEGVRNVAQERTLRACGLWLARGALVLALAVIVFTPQLAYWHVVYGSAFAMPQGKEYVRLGSPMILELLYSARNGWFSTTPIAYLAVIGLAFVPKPARLIAAGLAVAVLVQVYLNSCIMDWWGMASWGQRRLCSMTLPLVVGLTALLWRVGVLARRLPVAARHAIAILVMLPFLIMNVRGVRRFRGGKAAPAEIEATCCERVPSLVRPYAKWIYDRIGNPFELPASALFAIRHDVSLSRWDGAVGNYPVIPPANALYDGTLFEQHGSWRIGYPGAEPYLIGGWSPSRQADRPLRWTMTDRATAIVPNLMPYDQRITVWLAPGGAHDVTLRWDGEVVAARTLSPGWNDVQFVLSRVPVGEHELTIDAPVGMTTTAPPFPEPRVPVGVAVGSVDVQLLAPR
jgi:hypothetical protein